MADDRDTKIVLSENLKIEVPIRGVIGTDKGYAVAEFKNISANLWVLISKYYSEITDAYAHLGKLYQRDMLRAVPEKYRLNSTPVPPEEEPWSGDKKVKTVKF